MTSGLLPPDFARAPSNAHHPGAPVAPRDHERRRSAPISAAIPRNTSAGMLIDGRSMSDAIVARVRCAERISVCRVSIRFRARFRALATRCSPFFAYTLAARLPGQKLERRVAFCRLSVQRRSSCAFSFALQRTLTRRSACAGWSGVTARAEDGHRQLRKERVPPERSRLRLERGIEGGGDDQVTDRKLRGSQRTCRARPSNFPGVTSDWRS